MMKIVDNALYIPISTLAHPAQIFFLQLYFSPPVGSRIVCYLQLKTEYPSGASHVFY